MSNFAIKSYKKTKNMSTKNPFGTVSLSATDFSDLESETRHSIFNEDFGMILNVSVYKNKFIQPGQPYRLVEGRIAMVTCGEAQCEYNLEEYHITAGDVILLTPETIVELKSCSEDLNMMGVIFKENIPALSNIVTHTMPQDWQEMMRMMTVLWEIAQHEPFRHETVRRMVEAIISNIQDISRMEQSQIPGEKQSRQEQIFSRFKALVNEHCIAERNIPFYADKLFLSPHHLSSVISKVSGKSVMYWINRAVILQAKVLLKNSDLMVFEVAERLNFPNQSFFGKFFKRETGVTPKEYRDS